MNFPKISHRHHHLTSNSTLILIPLALQASFSLQQHMPKHIPAPTHFHRINLQAKDVLQTYFEHFSPPSRG